ncbi:uncharacterized protein BO80DRAFT_36460 [Aspergillus ibericus CBS 121593]|uniref:Uncharacterized protein n=1 Tax=Aspergillus ibericus CBS 121593 TaxID=1448316 RepID=A0A395H4C3_9EURO|nr:hypothetical protein BO80DRAFT_36460 [Aspergillus ibericus CBS 121593]RAL02490.1 hypothetical protein BO80DRAFT_36460 [Aspergillus ibericus CBS 121593]
MDKTDLQHPHDAIVSNLSGLSCRIYIRKPLAPSRLDGDSTVQTLVEDFIDNLQQLSSNLPSHNILSWPLVVTGYAARNPAR